MDNFGQLCVKHLFSLIVARCRHMSRKTIIKLSQSGAVSRSQQSHIYNLFQHFLE
jgi:hypothetical protein